MRRDQLSTSNQQNPVPPVPTTIWHQLPLTSQQQLAHLLADLIQRVRSVRLDKEGKYER